uniref:Uncharacterized protein n=1 Tax=Oryza punctata TaxID=4537 RepID=A0A0E0JZ06_ORYPU
MLSAATRQAATMFLALFQVGGCPELGAAAPCFVCGGGIVVPKVVGEVIGPVPMVVAAAPLVGLAPVVEATNFSLPDLGMKAMISRPASNVEAIAIGMKYTSLKRKYTDLKEFVATAKLKDGFVSALDHFHEEHSRRFALSLQDLSYVFVNPLPSKSKIDPQGSPAGEQANVKGFGVRYMCPPPMMVPPQDEFPRASGVPSFWHTCHRF